MPTVTVTGHPDNATGTSDAASQGTVAERELRLRPLMHSGDLLELVPGLIVTQHSAQGKANQYFLRGFNLDHGTDFATWVAGIPVNLPTHAHGHGYTDLNFLIPELVERIDFRKGPYDAIHGDFASAGSARIELRTSVDAPFAQLNLGRWGHQRMLAVVPTTAATGTRMLAALEAQRGDGPWENPQALRRVNALLSLSEGSRAHGFTATLMAYRGRWNATDQIPLRALDAGLISRLGAVDSSDGGESQRVGGSLVWRRTLADGHARSTLWFSHYRLDLASNFTYAMERPDTGDQRVQRDARGLAGGHIARVWYGVSLGVPATTELGLQWRADRIRVGLLESIARQPVAVLRDDRVLQGNLGLYGEHAQTWSAWLRTVLGLRLDHHRWDVRSDQQINSGHASASLISPKISAILAPARGLEVFLNAGTGHHSNDGRGILTRSDPLSGVPVQPATALARTRGAEIGLRLDRVPGLQTSLALWRLDLSSELVFLGDAGTTAPSRASRRHGIEWSSRYQYRSWLALDADVALSRARYRDDAPEGDRVPGSVGRMVSTSATLGEIMGWSARLQLRYLGARPLSADGRQQTPSTWMLSARLTRRLGHRAELWVEGFNLLNRPDSDVAYHYRSRLPGEAAAVADIHLHPVEPRQFRLGVRLNL